MGSGASLNSEQETDNQEDDFMSQVISQYQEVIKASNITLEHFYSLDEIDVLPFLTGTCNVQDPHVLHKLYTCYFDHKSSKPCCHPYLEKWGDIYHCCDCHNSISEPTSRIEYEDNMEQEVLLEDNDCYKNSPHESVNRGVCIGWVLDWTKKYDLWNLPTWKVRRQYILPATSKLRCRYVDLPEMKELKFNHEGIVEEQNKCGQQGTEEHVVGRAVTFCSHCWGAKWGDLVAAISDGADLGRY